jgi:hypothetical protein
VVYSSVIDNLVNNEGKSINKAVSLPYPIGSTYDPTIFDGGLTVFDNNTTTFNSLIISATFFDGGFTYFDNNSTIFDDESTTLVYPNSLDNMRNQVIDTVGQVSNILPRWMLSIQENGKVLGFTPAWVLAYTKPGQSAQILYNISQSVYANELNKIQFKVDRYELDRLLSIHWDPITHQWTPPGSQTTFDRFSRSSNLIYLGVVDYGTTQAFIDLNHRTVEYINSIGGIDGVITENINGKKLIFVDQENYNSPKDSYNPGPLTPDEAWTDNTPFDAESGFDGVPYDLGVIIPGQLQSQMDPTVKNERMGIWLINVDSSNVVTLTLLENTITNNYVTVRTGKTYNQTSLYVPSAPASGLLLINWQPLSVAPINETTFDMNSMLFIDPVDMYTNTNAYDAYLVFPHRTILG